MKRNIDKIIKEFETVYSKTMPEEQKFALDDLLNLREATRRASGQYDDSLTIIYALWVGYVEGYKTATGARK